MARREFSGLIGGPLVADVYGPIGAPTVLLLHGGGQTRHAWGRTAQTLADAGWRTVALDLPGHGDSAWAADGDYRIETLAVTMCRIWRDLGTPLAVVGASLGGLISMAAVGCVDAPPINALVLVDIAPRMEEAGVERIVRFMRARPDGFASLEEAAQHIAAYRGRPMKGPVDGLKKNLRLNGQGRWVWHWDPRLMSDANHNHRRDADGYERALRGLQAPTLLLRGQRSDVISEEDARALVQTLPQARFVDLKGAGHMIAGDANDAFAASVAAFLQEVMPPAQSAANLNQEHGMNLRSFTLRDLIVRNASLYGSKTAMVFGHQRVTHAQYAERTAQLAAGLAAAGVEQGDRLAILASNCLEYVDLFGAAARLGAIVVPINWRLSAEEVAYLIEDVSPTILIVGDEFKALLPQQGLEDTLRYTLGAALAPWQPFSELYLDRDVPSVDLSDDAGFVVIHTAAVGGRPRGALLSHRGLIAAGMQTQLVWRLTPADLNLGVLPLFHVAAIGFMLATQQAGGATLLLTRFDPASLVKHIDEGGGSLIGTFPPMLGALLDAAAAQGSALDHLRVVSGIDVPETIARLRTSCPQATFWSAYGQTETSGSISLAPFDECPGSAGRPTAMNTVAVVDELDRPLPTGATGEIVVRGPMVFQGYWRRDEDNAFTFRNGWHHTGDMGRIDADGYLWYSGRSPAKELIKPGGENVYPAEVERAILEHPALAQAVVIGVPDVQWGEAVKAICVLKAGHTLSAEELIEFVGGRIARYKKPKHVVFVATLPRTAAGLMDREVVKAAHGRA